MTQEKSSRTSRVPVIAKSTPVQSGVRELHPSPAAAASTRINDSPYHPWWFAWSRHHWHPSASLPPGHTARSEVRASVEVRSHNIRALPHRKGYEAQSRGILAPEARGTT